MLDFRTFFESEDTWNTKSVDADDYDADNQPPTIPIRNPKEVGKYWNRVQPTDTNVINKQAVGVLVSQMADNTKNSPQWDTAQQGGDVYDVRYEEAIGGNLITANSPKYKDATATVTNRAKEQFRFYKTGPVSGGLRIKHPPLIYGPTDKELMFAIIMHELRHAADFINPQYDTVEASGKVFFDNNLYAKNLMEARAYAEQLNYLLQKFNYDTDAVMRILKGIKPDGTSPLRMDADILRAAKVYLEIYRNRKKTEGWLAKTMAAPLLGLGSVLGQGNVAPQAPDPPAATRVVVQQEVYQAAKYVHKILELGLFSNFVHFNPN